MHSQYIHSPVRIPSPRHGEVQSKLENKMFAISEKTKWTSSIVTWTWEFVAQLCLVLITSTRQLIVAFITKSISCLKACKILRKKRVIFFLGD